MKSRFLKFGVSLVLLLTAAFNVWALDNAVVIVNSDVAADHLSSDELKDIYTARTKYWSNGQAIIIIILPDKTDEALQQASGMDGSQFKTFWQRLAFSGRGSEPMKVDDAAELIALVASTKGAIALAPADAALTGVKKVDVK